MGDHNTATRLISVIDGAIEKGTKSGANIEITYGQVFALTGGTEASVYLAGSRELAVSDGGTPVPSEGFRVPAHLWVSPSDYVRVAIDQRGHRWIEEIVPVTQYPRITMDVENGEILKGDGTMPPEPDLCCNYGTRQNRALLVDALTVSPGATGGIVQTKVGPFNSGGVAFTVTYNTTPTNGNSLVAFLFSTDGRSIDSAGWTMVEEGTANGDSVSIWTKPAGISEPTAVHVGSSFGGSVGRLVLFEIDGTVDNTDSTSNDGASSPLTGPVAAPTAFPSLVLGAFIGQVATYAGDPTWTPLNGFTTNSFLRQSPGRLVSWVGNKNVASGTTQPSLTTTALYSGRTTASVSIALTVTVSDPVWDVPAPNTVDGNDATYHSIDGPQILRLDLAHKWRISKSRVYIGTDDAGSRTLTINAANLPDYSDKVTLAVETFTGLGSHTPQEVVTVFLTPNEYRYFELLGSDSERYIFSWELYEPNMLTGEDHTHDDIWEALNDNATDLDDYIASVATVHSDTTDPTVTNDSTEGYSIFSRWINTSSDEEFVATDVTTGAAVWVSTTSGGGGGGSSPSVKEDNVLKLSAPTVLDFTHGLDAVDAGSGRATIAVDESELTVPYANLSGVPSTFAPSAHHTAHENGGSDQIKLDDLDEPDDNTDLNASISAHGLLRKLDNNAGHYLDGTGGFSTPSGTYAAPTLQTFIQTVTNFQSGATTNVVTMAAPTSGNRLICFLGATGRGATSITQTNVTWTQLYTGNGSGVWGEVWLGVVSGSPGTTATLNFASSTRSQAYIVEVTQAYSTVGTATTATAGAQFLSIGPLAAAIGAQVICVVAAGSAGSGFVSLSCPFTKPATGGQGRFGWGTSFGTNVVGVAQHDGSFSTFAAMMVLS